MASQEHPLLLDYFTRIDEVLIRLAEILTQTNKMLTELLAPKILIPIHLEGKVGTTATEIVEGTQPFSSILIHNTHASNILYVSFDGTLFKKIEAGSLIELSSPTDQSKIKSPEFKLKASAADTTYEIIILE